MSGYREEDKVDYDYEDTMDYGYGVDVSQAQPKAKPHRRPGNLRRQSLSAGSENAVTFNAPRRRLSAGFYRESPNDDPKEKATGSLARPHRRQSIDTASAYREQERYSSIGTTWLERSSSSRFQRFTKEDDDNAGSSCDEEPHHRPGRRRSIGLAGRQYSRRRFSMTSSNGEDGSVDDQGPFHSNTHDGVISQEARLTRTNRRFRRELARAEVEIEHLKRIVLEERREKNQLQSHMKVETAQVQRLRDHIVCASILGNLQHRMAQAKSESMDDDSAKSNISESKQEALNQEKGRQRVVQKIIGVLGGLNM